MAGLSVCGTDQAAECCSRRPVPSPCPPGQVTSPSRKVRSPRSGLSLVRQLRSYIDSLQSVLAKRVNEQRAYFEDQLSRLGGYVSKKTSAAVKAISGKKGKRAKALPKYQSKKDKSVKWSGRGMTPVWMREEMKGGEGSHDRPSGHQWGVHGIHRGGAMSDDPCWVTSLANRF